MSRPKSVVLGKDPECLTLLLSIHAVENPRILDVTYNKGVMWKGILNNYNITKSDIDGTLEGLDLVADYKCLPLPEKSFDVIVMDLPHLPSVGSSSKWSVKYNTPIYSNGINDNNVSDNFLPFLQEAKRVLVPNGIVICKIADLIHNHRYQWQMCDFVNDAKSLGLTACDLLIKVDPCGGNMNSSKWKNIKHLRKSHCYFVVVRNGKKCEKC